MNNTDKDYQLLKHMYERPLDFVNEIQKRIYRRRAIKVSILFILLGLFPLVIELLILGFGGKTSWEIFGTRFRMASPYGSGNVTNSLLIIWYALIFVGLPYGIFRLFALRHYASVRARWALATMNPELQQFINAKNASRKNKWTAWIAALSGSITKVLIGIVLLMLTVAVAGVIVAIVMR